MILRGELAGEIYVAAKRSNIRGRMLTRIAGLHSC